MKQQLLATLEEWLDTEPEADPLTYPEKEELDLYSFYEELITLQNESRNINRKTAETLGKVDEELLDFSTLLETTTTSMQESLSNLSGNAVKIRDQRKRLLALTEMFDRLDRIAKAFANKPKESWWSKASAWKTSWENMKSGYQMGMSHFEAFLKEEGVEIITCLNTPFDPYTMAAISTVTKKDIDDNIITEVLSNGFRLHNETLKLAQVVVNKKGK